jgi:hypothetical protein
MAPMAPITPVPTKATTHSLQLASLATATYLSPSSGGSSFSEREGFGLAPYR